MFTGFCLLFECIRTNNLVLPANESNLLVLTFWLKVAFWKSGLLVENGLLLRPSGVPQ